jgi:hypothetical protein
MLPGLKGKARKKVMRDKAYDLNKTVVLFFIIDATDHNALRSPDDEFPVHLCL